MHLGCGYFFFLLQPDADCYRFVSYFHVSTEQIKAPAKHESMYPTLCS